MAALRRLGCLLADRPPAPGDERALLRTLLEVALDHSPRVEEAGPGVVYLDVAGLGSLFGSEDEIARRLRDAAAARGLEARVGIAGSRIGALVTARHGSGAAVIPPGEDTAHLASAPVSLLDLAPEMAARFDRWGIRTLGQLAALPGPALAARLGAEGTRLQRLARGEDPRPLLPWTAPATFEESIEPGWEVDALGPLGEMLTTLAERVCASLERRGLSADHLEWICRLTTGAAHEGRIAPAVPMNDPAAVAMLLRASLDSHPPRTPVVGLTLRAHPIRVSAAQESLTERARPTPRLLAATLARLAALVGAPHVGIPRVLDTHSADPLTLSPPGRGQGEGPGKGQGPVQPAPKSVHPAPSANEPSIHATQGRRHDERSIQAPSPQKRETTPRASLSGIAHAAPSAPVSSATSGSPVSSTSAPVLSFRRLRPAIAARVTLTAGRPVHLHADRLTAAIVASAGPWRSSGEWWTARSWLRDEWDVELSDGTLCRLANDGSAWSVDGIYD